MLKGNNGVTLVALVITIIVLLILAGVSISLVVGDNGVLNQAVNAADSTNEAAATTELEMAVTAAVADYMEDKYAGTTSASSVVLANYITTDLLAPNVADGFVITVTAWGTTTPGSKTTAEVEYRGETYTYTLEISSSGNSCKVTSGDKTGA